MKVKTLTGILVFKTITEERKGKHNLAKVYHTQKSNVPKNIVIFYCSF